MSDNGKVVCIRKSSFEVFQGTRGDEQLDVEGDQALNELELYIGRGLIESIKEVERGGCDLRCEPSQEAKDLVRRRMRLLSYVPRIDFVEDREGGGVTFECLLDEDFKQVASRDRLVVAIPNVQEANRNRSFGSLSMGFNGVDDKRSRYEASDERARQMRGESLTLRSSFQRQL
jgi:hypothetical protein